MPVFRMKCDKLPRICHRGCETVTACHTTSSQVYSLLNMANSDTIEKAIMPMPRASIA